MVEDVANTSLVFSPLCFATVQSSWLEPKKVRELTIVGTQRMMVCNELQPGEQLRIYDVCIEFPPPQYYEFPYFYHYGDSYTPYVVPDDPPMAEVRNFIDSIRTGSEPLSNGRHGLEVVKVLEAASLSLNGHGSPVSLHELPLTGRETSSRVAASTVSGAG